MILGAHDLLDNGIHLFAQIVERSPVWIFNEDKDVEILWVRGIAVQDFVVENDLLLFLLVINWLYRSSDLFEVIIVQAGLGLDHGQRPHWTFIVGRAAAFCTCGAWLCGANDSNTKR